MISERVLKALNEQVGRDFLFISVSLNGNLL